MCKHFKGKEYVFMTHNSIIDTRYFLLLFLLTIIILDILRPSSRSTFHPSQSPLHPDLYGLHQCSSQFCSDNGRHKQLIRWQKRDWGIYCPGSLPDRLQIGRDWISPPKFYSSYWSFYSCSYQSPSRFWEILHLLAPSSLIVMASCPC